MRRLWYERGDGGSSMKDTFAVDILGELPKLSLEKYGFVRIEQGRDWLDIDIRDGIIELRGSHGLVIRPRAANVVQVEVKR